MPWRYPVHRSPSFGDDTRARSAALRGRGAAVTAAARSLSRPADSWPAAGRSEIHLTQRGGVKSSVDDLALGRGVVLSRAATTLRSIETKPLD